MIELEGVTRSFRGRRVLDAISLRIGAGERVGIVGPNGSGKTTLLRCVMGLLRAEGRIRVEGRDPWAEHATVLDHVAYVPQRPPALDVPVRDVLRLWERSRPRTEAIDGCAARLGLRLPPSTTRFTELSGGTQQKLLVAMALCSRAGTLLCDEPTASLDPLARAAFFELLDGLAPAPAVLLSSHRLGEVRRLVRRVIVLAEGRVVFDDRLEAFLSDPRLSAAAGMNGD